VTGLSVAGISATYGANLALRGVSLEVPKGCIAAVLGPSGSGKSTLLRVIAGLHRPTQGEIRLGDQLVSGSGCWVNPERRRVGLVPQGSSLFPHLTVAENIGFGMRDKRSAAAKARIAHFLALADLSDLAKRRPHEISGGQAQRVAVLRALAPEPAIVLLDEPFSALDVGLRATLRDQVWSLLREAHATAIWVTHDRAEALGYADQVSLLHAGQLVQTGTPQEVYEQPASPWAATFIGDGVIISGRSDGRVADTAWGFVAHQGGQVGRVELLVRPEFVQVWPRQQGVRARVLSSRFLGHETITSLELLADHNQVLTANISHGPVPAAGEVVGVGIAGAVPAFQ
jgi:iron(III) transport system ATP-binding protein